MWPRASHPSPTSLVAALTLPVPPMPWPRANCREPVSPVATLTLPVPPMPRPRASRPGPTNTSYVMAPSQLPGPHLTHGRPNPTDPTLFSTEGTRPATGRNEEHLVRGELEARLRLRGTLPDERIAELLA